VISVSVSVSVMRRNHPGFDHDNAVLPFRRAIDAQAPEHHTIAASGTSVVAHPRGGRGGRLGQAATCAYHWLQRPPRLPLNGAKGEVTGSTTGAAHSVNWPPGGSSSPRTRPPGTAPRGVAVPRRLTPRGCPPQAARAASGWRTRARPTTARTRVSLPAPQVTRTAPAARPRIRRTGRPTAEVRSSTVAGQPHWRLAVGVLGGCGSSSSRARRPGTAASGAAVLPLRRGDSYRAPARRRRHAPPVGGGPGSATPAERVSGPSRRRCRGGPGRAGGQLRRSCGRCRGSYGRRGGLGGVLSHP
jgi:hypothetical protein